MRTRSKNYACMGRERWGDGGILMEKNPFADDDNRSITPPVFMSTNDLGTTRDS